MTKVYHAALLGGQVNRTGNGDDAMELSHVMSCLPCPSVAPKDRPPRKKAQQAVVCALLREVQVSSSPLCKVQKAKGFTEQQGKFDGTHADRSC